MSNELLRYFGEGGFGGGCRLGGRLCVVLGWVVGCERRCTFEHYLDARDVKECLSVDGREIRKEEKKRSG